MAKEIFNRYENKYLLNYDQYIEINNIVSEYMVKDAYNKDDSTYLISNIYFDTEDDHLIRTSLQKPKYKEKIRMRAYGPTNDDDFVYLEIKKKFDGIVNKRRTKLKLKEANEFIMNGKLEKIEDYMNVQVVREIEYFLKMNKVIPKVYLSYERLAYFAKDDDDLRLTIDREIRADRKNLSLNYVNVGNKLLDDKLYLMEIKSASAMPLWLTHTLSKNKIYPTSFSKYGKEYKDYLLSKTEENFFTNYRLELNEARGGLYGYSY